MTTDSSPLNPLPDTGSQDDQPRKPRGRKKASATAETTTESQGVSQDLGKPLSVSPAKKEAKKTTAKAGAKAKAPAPKRAASPKTSAKSASKSAPAPDQTEQAAGINMTPASGADISSVDAADVSPKGREKKTQEKKTGVAAQKNVRQPRKKAAEAVIESASTPPVADHEVSLPLPVIAQEIPLPSDSGESAEASAAKPAPKKTVRTPRASTKAKSSAASSKSAVLDTNDEPKSEVKAAPKKGRASTGGKRVAAKETEITPDISSGNTPADQNREFSDSDARPTVALTITTTVVTSEMPVDAAAHEPLLDASETKNRVSDAGHASLASSAYAVTSADEASGNFSDELSEPASNGATDDNASGDSFGDASAGEETTGRTRRPRRRGGRGRRRNNNTDQMSVSSAEGDSAGSGPENRSSDQFPAGEAPDDIVFNEEAKWEYDEFSLGAGSVETPAPILNESGEVLDSASDDSAQEDEVSAESSEDRSSGREGQRRSRSRGRRSRNKKRNNAEQEARSSQDQDSDLNDDADFAQDDFERAAGSSRRDDSDDFAESRDSRQHRRSETSYSDEDSDLDEDDDLDFDDDLDDDEEDDQNFRRGKRKMFVSVLPGEEVEVVLSEEGLVHEYYVEMLHQAKTKGNIYKGIINNVDANLQAAFVSYGAVKNGFLQIDEVHPEYFLTHHEASKGRKFPPIQKVLKPGQEILVQVVKEPTGNKGAFLTSYLSIPGRFLVLTPGREQIGVSRKVDEEGERSRLRGLLEGLNPGPGLGVIVRTVSMGASKTSLRSDLQFLKRLWKDVRKNGSTETAPCLIYQEPDLASRAVRDYLTEEVCEIWVDDESTAEHIRGMAELLYPRRSGLVKLHRDYNQNLWERFNIQKQLDQIQSREVVLPSGGRLVFDQTEALMAIDINTAKATGKSNFESTVLRTNMEAAEIIPRQLKLRDVGGQVVIDFIEMREQSHWRNVEKTLRNAMKTDRARHDIGKISRFGLMEIVRQRLASSAISVSSETCPHCTGTGVRRNLEWQALQSMREINRQMRKAQASNQSKLSYQAEAELALYLLNHKRERLMELEKAYKVQLELQPMPISIG